MLRLQQLSAIRTESLLVKLSIRINNLSFVNMLTQTYAVCFIHKVFPVFLCYSNTTDRYVKKRHLLCI